MVDLVAKSSRFPVFKVFNDQKVTTDCLYLHFTVSDYFLVVADIEMKATKWIKVRDSAPSVCDGLVEVS